MSEKFIIPTIFWRHAGTFYLDKAISLLFFFFPLGPSQDDDFQEKPL